MATCYSKGINPWKEETYVTNIMQDLISQVAMAGISLSRLMCYYSKGNKACAQEKIIFYRNWKGHWRCLRLGTWFAQHLPVRIFARGVTQGSGEMTADAPVIPRSKINEVWKGHWRFLRLGTWFAQHLPMRILARGRWSRLETQAFPKTWQYW